MSYFFPNKLPGRIYLTLDSKIGALLSAPEKGSLHSLVIPQGLHRCLIEVLYPLPSTPIPPAHLPRCSKTPQYTNISICSAPTLREHLTKHPPLLCLAIWWEREFAVADSHSQLGSRDLSPGISPGILIRGFGQSKLESRAGVCQHMPAYAGIF